MPFPFFVAKRAIHGVATKRFVVPFTEVSLRPETGFCALLKRENAPCPCFLFSRIAEDRYSLCCRLRESILIQISNFCNLIESGKQEKLSFESAMSQEVAALNIKIREASLLQYHEKISTSLKLNASLFAIKRQNYAFDVLR